MSLVVRRVLPLALVALALGALARRAAEPLPNDDTYFHLRLGHELLDPWSPHDPGSVTRFATADWWPTQWLSEVALARVEDLAGLAGVAWLAGALHLGVVLALYLTARRHVAAVAAAPLTLVAVAACLPALSMRPQVLSIVLTSVTVAWWVRTQQTGRLPWALVPLTWLWANLHGMWTLGLVIGAVAAVGLALGDRSLRSLARYGAVVVAAALAAALTPVGPGLYRAVLLVGSRTEYFGEWGRPDPLAPATLCAAALVAVPVLLVPLRARSGGAAPWLDVALLAAAAVLAACSTRTVPIAAALALPLAARAVAPYVETGTRVRRGEAGVLAAGVVVPLVALGLAVPHTSADPRPVPAWLDAEVATWPPGTALLDSWADGGLLMWRYPQVELLLHGYADMFTTAELERNVAIERVAPGWEPLLRATGIEHAFLRADSPLAASLERRGWVVERASDGVVLLSAPAGWVTVDATS